MATLQKELAGALETVLDRFEGIDRSSSSFAALMEAQERLSEEEGRDAFAREFLTTQALYEFLEPDTGFKPDQRADYRWAAKVYQSVQPAMTPDALLWQRLGAKTHELIAAEPSNARGLERRAKDHTRMTAPSATLVTDRSQGARLATIQELRVTGRPTTTGARPMRSSTCSRRAEIRSFR